jgi:hypothetical protein
MRSAIIGVLIAAFLVTATATARSQAAPALTRAQAAAISPNYVNR